MDSPVMEEGGEQFLTPEMVRENFSTYDPTRRERLTSVVRKAGVGATLLWAYFLWICRGLVRATRRLWFVVGYRGPRRRGFDAPLNFVILLVIALLLLMSVMLLSPTERHREEPDPSRPLRMVNYYRQERQRERNEELQDCAAGYGMREKTFNADRCVQRFQQHLSSHGWSEATLRYQEDRLMQREKLPCLCSPMYGASFSRLTLRTMASTLHCMAPRVIVMKKGQAVITERSQLLPQEGRRIVRAAHISLYCLQTHSLQSAGVIGGGIIMGNGTVSNQPGSTVEYVGEEIFRHISDQEAFCVQFCLELLTGANISQQ